MRSKERETLSLFIHPSTPATLEFDKRKEKGVQEQATIMTLSPDVIKRGNIVVSNDLKTPLATILTTIIPPSLRLVVVMDRQRIKGTYNTIDDRRYILDL